MAANPPRKDTKPGMTRRKTTHGKNVEDNG
jgi:hypothetical protein